MRMKGSVGAMPDLSGWLNLTGAAVAVAVGLLGALGAAVGYYARTRGARRRRLRGMYLKALKQLRPARRGAAPGGVTAAECAALERALKKRAVGATLLKNSWNPEEERRALLKAAGPEVSPGAVDLLMRREFELEMEMDEGSFLKHRAKEQERKGYFARLASTPVPAPSPEEGPAAGAAGQETRLPARVGGIFKRTLGRVKYFSDRVVELGALRAFFATVGGERLMILDGLPGMGKTTLAVKAVEDVVQRDYHLLWADCTPGMTAQQLLQEIGQEADALGYGGLPDIMKQLSPIADAQDGIDLTMRENIQTNALIGFLEWAAVGGKSRGVRPLALFLDNYESVQDLKLHRLVWELAARAPAVKLVIITADRGPLLDHIGVAYAQPTAYLPCDLDALPADDCADLIRAEAGDLGIVDLAHLTRQDLEEIMRKTGGVPFHLRVLINMARYYPLKSLLSLPDYERDSDALLRTLYESLSPDGQRIAAAAALLRLPVGFDDLREISGAPSPGYAEALKALVDRFALKLSGSTYVMRKPLVDYLRRRMQGGRDEERRGYHRRAAAVYDRLARAAHAQPSAGGVGEVDLRLESGYHYVSAGDLAGSATVLAPVIQTLLQWGRYKELDDILSGFKVAHPGRPLADVLPSPELRLAFAETLYARDAQGNDPGYRDEIEGILNELRTTGEGEIRIVAMQRLAFIKREWGQDAEARRIYEESLELARSAGSEKLVAEALYGLQHVAYLQGRYDDVPRYNEERARILEELGRRQPDEREYVDDNLAWTKANNANVYRERGNLTEALGLYRAALDTWERLPNRHWRTGWTSYDIGQILYQQGEHQRAREWFDRALGIFTEVAYRIGVGHVEIELGRNGSKLRTPSGAPLLTREECLEHVDSALADKVRGMKTGEAFAITAKGEILLNFDAPDDALPFLEEGLRRESEQQNPRKIARCLQLIGLATEKLAHRSLQAQDRDEACARFDAALGRLREAREQYRRAGSVENIWGIMEDVARVQGALQECQARASAGTRARP